MFDADYIQMCEQKDTCRGILGTGNIFTLSSHQPAAGLVKGLSGLGAGLIPNVAEIPLSQGTKAM